MMTKIGIVSGEVLTLLEEVNRPLSVAELEFHLEEPFEIILMSLGWLARRGIIHIEEKQNDYVVFAIGVQAEKRMLGKRSRQKI